MLNFLMVVKASLTLGREEKPWVKGLDICIMDMAFSSLKSPPSPTIFMIPMVNQCASHGRDCYVLHCVILSIENVGVCIPFGLCFHCSVGGFIEA